MADLRRFSEVDVLRLSIAGIGKINRLGVRGVTLCSQLEIEAMAILAASHPALNGPLKLPSNFIEGVDKETSNV